MGIMQINSTKTTLPSSDRLSSQIYKKRFWENPTFLFVCMGVLTVSAMMATYFISQRYHDPVLVISSVAIVAMTITFFGGILIKTIDKLAELNNMKTDFVSIASHQLRTPLSIIKWYAEFLSREEKQSNLTDEQKKYIKIINDSNQRMIRLVNDLLDISRIESGRIKIHPEPANLVELIQNIIQENKILADKKNIKISFKHEQNIPLVNMDPKRISMVIENLLSNAIKYSTVGGEITVIVIEKKMEFNQKYQSILSVSIVDTGVGIPKNEYLTIFERFSQSSVTADNSGGTGLGLSICREMIAKHHGKIWAESNNGNGSLFTFIIPKVQ